MPKNQITTWDRFYRAEQDAEQIAAKLAGRIDAEYATISRCEAEAEQRQAKMDAALVAEDKAEVMDAELGLNSARALKAQAARKVSLLRDEVKRSRKESAEALVQTACDLLIEEQSIIEKRYAALAQMRAAYERAVEEHVSQLSKAHQLYRRACEIAIENGSRDFSAIPLLGGFSPEGLMPDLVKIYLSPTRPPELPALKPNYDIVYGPSFSVDGQAQTQVDFYAPIGGVSVDKQKVEFLQGIQPRERAYDPLEHV